MKFLKHNSKDNLNLNMGLVKENVAIVKNEDVEKWVGRGFSVIKKYPIFHYAPNKSEKIMLGRPLTITNYGIDKLLNSKIIGCSTCGGTYGMGGPGFFQLKLRTVSGEVIVLSFAMWYAGEYILFDNRIIESHPNYFNEYNPWIMFSDTDEHLWENTSEEFERNLSDCIISKIEITKNECSIKLIDSHNRPHSLWTAMCSEKFPPKGGTGKRQNSFTTQTIEEVLLIIYDGSWLVI